MRTRRHHSRLPDRRTAMTYHIKTPEQQSFAQNLAAIAAEFHTHRLYNDFYDTFGKYIDGFIGNYDLCVRMAEALTDWENSKGGLLASAKTHLHMNQRNRKFTRRSASQVHRNRRHPQRPHRPPPNSDPPASKPDITDQLIQELRLTIPDHPLIPLPQQGY